MRGMCRRRRSGNAWSQESLSSPARRPVYCNVESMCYSPLSHSLTAVKRARCEVRDLSRHPSHSGDDSRIYTDVGLDALLSKDEDSRKLRLTCLLVDSRIYTDVGLDALLLQKMKIVE
ncbi:hypothetical protein RRG08_034177, partial [Elysia crispata]